MTDMQPPHVCTPSYGALSLTRHVGDEVTGPTSEPAYEAVEQPYDRRPAHQFVFLVNGEDVTARLACYAPLAGWFTLYSCACRTGQPREYRIGERDVVTLRLA